MWWHFFVYGGHGIGLAMACAWIGGYGVAKGGLKELWKLLNKTTPIQHLPEAGGEKEPHVGTRNDKAS